MNKPPPDDDVGDEGFLYRTAPKISRPIAASFLTTKLQRTTNHDALDRPSTNSLMGFIDRELPPRKLRLRLVSRRCWDAPDQLISSISSEPVARPKSAWSFRPKGYGGEQMLGEADVYPQIWRQFLK